MKKPGAVLILFILLGLFSVLLAPRVLQISKLNERSKNLEAEIQKLKTDNQSLENTLRLLREDPVYLEKMGREKFNRAKQGEIVYKVVKEGDVKPAS